MVQTNNRFFDELARMMTGAAGAAQGMRQEIETMIRSQAERWAADFDFATRDEVDALRAMAESALKENEALKKRVAALEKELKPGKAKAPAKRKKTASAGTTKAAGTRKTTARSRSATSAKSSAKAS